MRYILLQVPFRRFLNLLCLNEDKINRDHLAREHIQMRSITLERQKLFAAHKNKLKFSKASMNAFAEDSTSIEQLGKALPG